jgi:hypothetical protein
MLGWFGSEKLVAKLECSLARTEVRATDPRAGKWPESIMLRMDLDVENKDKRCGAGCRIRTRDLRFTKPLLYQLS